MSDTERWVFRNVPIFRDAVLCNQGRKRSAESAVILEVDRADAVQLCDGARRIRSAEQQRLFILHASVSGHHTYPA